MATALQTSLDALSGWRRGLDRGLDQLASMLAEHALLDSESQALADSLRQRLASDRLVVAFVAEFSRGKSELINALFFGDSGRRVMPASPGRTTMCPVELAWDGQRAPSLQLLPIATRMDGQTVASLRQQPSVWRTLPLPVADPDAMAQAVLEVTRTQRVPVDQARALGFWDDDHPGDNPPRDANDLVEVPAWRHALINYPHPLLRRGLVVIDTPGLNAIGAEPELTLGLLPSAHATVYLLAADTGVTRSDLAIWRDHLGDRACERFVVLNKIDMLADPMLEPAQVESLLQSQCDDVAGTLGVERARVFPLSARRALAAKVLGDAGGLAESRLPQLERALQDTLLPQRSQVIGRMVEDGALNLHQGAMRRLSSQKRQLGEQLFELRNLRGKSSSRMALMSGRLATESEEFERCVPRVAALRVVLNKQQQLVMDCLGSERVRLAVQRMRQGTDASLFKLGAARAFEAMGRELALSIDQAEGQTAEIETMLAAGHSQINTEFGFSLTTAPRPSLDNYRAELESIEQAYSRYLGFTQVWRQAQPGFMDQFTRMLLSKLRLVFEGAATEVEQWVRSASIQIDEQLRDRRRLLAQRQAAFERIRTAESELERSILDLQSQEYQTQKLIDRLGDQVDALRQLAASPPLPNADVNAAAAAPAAGTPRLHLVPPAGSSAARGAA